MDFFKSVFSDPTPTSSPDPSPPSSPTAPISPETTRPATTTTNSSWQFGSTIFKTLASRSESLVDNYYKDLRELGSGLRKETSVIRQAASRVVQDLPARLESGAAIAQESLEAVGQAIDNVGSTVSEIIGKDLNFASNESDDADINPGGSSKPYSRIEATVRSLQCDLRTYCDPVEEIGYGDWKLGFRVEEKREEIRRLVDGDGPIKEIYGEIVPEKVDEETFWCRYFYRVDKVVKAEEARLRIVKRAILAEEEEDLSWDLDDDDDGNEEKGKGVVENRDGASVSGTKSGDALLDEERLVDIEKEVSSDGKLGSDISIISSQRSSHAEDDLGWDKIEDMGSGDETKVTRLGSPSSGAGLPKDLGSMEDEELTWDVEEDDEPVKFSRS